MTSQDTIKDLQKIGFSGFVTIDSLIKNNAQIPKQMGVYMIVYPTIEKPKFKEIGSGGHFKGRNPNVAIDVLENNWVDGTSIVYIGKAGSENGKATLQSRLKQYFDFGQGKPVGHWGGRFIWQLVIAKELLVCWKTTLEEPSEIESYLIKEFKNHYNRRPFANLKD